MAHLHVNNFIPAFTSWDAFGSDGLWLQNFVSMLNCLPSKKPDLDQSEMEAFQKLISLVDSLVNTKGWCDRVSLASTWDNTYLVPQEFAAFVSEGRRSAMTYRQVRKFLKVHSKELFGFSTSEEAGLRCSLDYLGRLRELRVQVRKVIDFIDMDSTFEAKGLVDDKIYKFNPRKLYAEFKSHYAYETALCIPMYQLMTIS